MKNFFANQDFLNVEHFESSLTYTAAERINRHRKFASAGL